MRKTKFIYFVCILGLIILATNTNLSIANEKINIIMFFAALLLLTFDKKDFKLGMLPHYAQIIVI